MKSKLTVSLAQMKVLSANKNIKKVLEYIRRASKKSDIICFPECIFNGKKVHAGKELVPIQTACKAGNIFAVINGYFKDKGKKYNRTYLIDNKGKIIGLYDKIFLWIEEKRATRGKQVKVFNTSLGKIGLCTCWDMFFPSIFTKLKQKGAEIIFCPSYWPDNLKKEAKYIEHAPVAIAYTYMTYFVYCNALFKGKISVSQIAGPWGEIKKIKYKEGMITATIYSERLKRFKKHFVKGFYDREELY